LRLLPTGYHFAIRRVVVVFGVADRVRSLRQRLVTLSLLVLGIPALTINALYVARELNRLEESYSQLANSTLRVIAAQYQAGMRSFMQGRQAAIAQSLDWVRLPPTSGQDGRLRRMVAFERQLVTIDTSLPFVTGISVLDLNNGYVASSVGSVIDEASLEEVTRYRLVPGQPILTPRHTAHYYRAVARTDPPVISYYLPLDVISKPERVVLQMDVSARALEAPLDLDGSRVFSWVALIDGNRVLASSGTEDLAMPRDVNLEIPGTPWLLAAQTDLPTLAAARTNVGLLAVAIAAMTVLYMVGVLRILSRWIVRPVTRMSGELHAVELGGDASSISVPPVKELAVLAVDVNRMLDRIDDLHHTVLTHERAHHQAEISALQARIAPHFLFNTLETIRGLALSGENKRAADATRGLSSILRYTVDEDGSMATVGAEIRAVRDYLSLQEVRFGFRVVSKISVEDGSDAISLPRLAIQPVVENVFSHAAKVTEEPIHVAITVYRTEEGVVIEVRDDGPGMTPERLAEVLDRLDQANASLERHDALHGLTNVHQRLRLLYGPEGGISIASEAGVGTTVLIHVPSISPAGLSERGHE
jgi:signal transduction histidine kinase